MDPGVWLSRSAPVTARSITQSGALHTSSVSVGTCAGVLGRVNLAAPATEFVSRAAVGTKAIEGGFSRICVKAFKDKSPWVDEKTELRFGPVPTSSFNPRMPRTSPGRRLGLKGK